MRSSRDPVCQDLLKWADGCCAEYSSSGLTLSYMEEYLVCYDCNRSDSELKHQTESSHVQDIFESDNQTVLLFIIIKNIKP